LSGIVANGSTTPGRNFEIRLDSLDLKLQKLSVEHGKGIMLFKRTERRNAMDHCDPNLPYPQEDDPTHRRIS
jgi:hypothetical protein